MKQFIFSIVLGCLMQLTAQVAVAQEQVISQEQAADTVITRYDRRIHRMRKHWESLIPTQRRTYPTPSRYPNPPPWEWGAVRGGAGGKSEKCGKKCSLFTGILVQILLVTSNRYS